LRAKILIYECLYIGHHPSYLRICVEAFLEANVAVILATPTLAIAQKHLGGRLTSQVEFEMVADLKDNSFIEDLISLARKHNPKNILILPFDEFISPILRRAFWGSYPSGSLNGLIAGIYFRPRCTDPHEKGIRNWVKKIGLKKLLRRGFFSKLFINDTMLLVKNTIGPRQDFLDVFKSIIDPWEKILSYSKYDARNHWGISNDKKVFLFYGTGAYRKGLTVALEAMEKCGDFENNHLLCVGAISPERKLKVKIEELVQAGRATLIDRYVDLREEGMAFSACDFVLMPYINHYGSSGVISKSAIHQRSVICSDEGLLANLVKAHKIGVCFPTKDSTLLAKVMNSSRSEFSVGLVKYAELTDPLNFKRTLIDNLLN
jgi:glycosyltransferase involved in cell wall biosynthesis